MRQKNSTIMIKQNQGQVQTFRLLVSYVIQAIKKNSRIKQVLQRLTQHQSTENPEQIPAITHHLYNPHQPRHAPINGKVLHFHYHVLKVYTLHGQSRIDVSSTVSKKGLMHLQVPVNFQEEKPKSHPNSSSATHP